ncbi:cobalamin biosynthesis protein [Nocardia sp. NPDC056541]|uniref:cobalamin biosynthesis protein n=1 Tax=Nocardia sp. NPDC056541 TaxID=3345860 RepID=UPI00366CA382
MAVGIGIRPGTDAERIVRAVDAVIGDRTIACLATLDRRAIEPAVGAAAAAFGVPVMAFSAEQLAEVEVEHSSERVSAAVGTASVAEAAALLAGGGELVCGRTIVDGTAVAVAVVSPRS